MQQTTISFSTFQKKDIEFERKTLDDHFNNFVSEQEVILKLYRVRITTTSPYQEKLKSSQDLWNFPGSSFGKFLLNIKLVELFDDANRHYMVIKVIVRKLLRLLLLKQEQNVIFAEFSCEVCVPKPNSEKNNNVIEKRTLIFRLLNVLLIGN